MYSRYWFSKADNSARTAALIIPTIRVNLMTLPELSRAFPMRESRNMARFWRVDGFATVGEAFRFDADSYMLAN
jgi:hypothetical protein